MNRKAGIIGLLADTMFAVREHPDKESLRARMQTARGLLAELGVAHQAVEEMEASEFRYGVNEERAVYVRRDEAIVRLGGAV